MNLTELFPMGLPAIPMHPKDFKAGRSILTFETEPDEEQLFGVIEAAIRWEIFMRSNRVADIDEFPVAHVCIENYTPQLRFLERDLIVEPRVWTGYHDEHVTNPEWETAPFYARFAFSGKAPIVRVFYERRRLVAYVEASETEFLTSIRPRIDQ